MSVMRYMLLPMALLAACGCGLKDYEQRMDQERRRAKIFDRQESQLGGLLQVPNWKDKRAWAWPVGPIDDQGKQKATLDVYLRMPRGCQDSPQSSFAYLENTPDELVLFRFPFMQDKPDEKGILQPKPGWNLFLACDKAGGFRQRVLSALRAYVRKENGNLQEPKESFARKQLDIDLAKGGVDHIEYDYVSFPGPAATIYQLYVYPGSTFQFALIFQTPADQINLLETSRDLCLKSFDMDEDAVIQAKRSTFRPGRK